MSVCSKIFGMIPVLIYTFILCYGFSVVFDFRGKKNMCFAALGGVLSWGIFLLTAPLGSDLLQYFVSTLVASAYAEIMARRFKSPVTGFLMLALLPLVPGGGIYYTMEHCVNGDTGAFLETGLHTFAIAGALAIGVLMVSSVVRLWHTVRAEYRK